MTTELAIPTQALPAIHDPNRYLIDVEFEKLRLENFREFVSQNLKKELGHFGRMPGVNRDFLLQPGAEVLYRAFEARPEYDFIDRTVDPVNEYCHFQTRCRVVHVTTGTVLGEAFGSATSLEFAKNCTAVEAQGTVPTVSCPIHGTSPARHWGRGQSAMSACGKKIPLGLDRTLQNTESKARKRAMVAAIRTVGCVSERFTQDDDFVGDRDDSVGEGEAAAPVSVPRPAQTKPNDVWQEGKDWKMHCPQHGVSFAKEWNKGASVKCGRKNEDGSWCSVLVDKPKRAAAPQPQALNGKRKLSPEDIQSLKDAMALVKGSDIGTPELVAYLEEQGVPPEGGKVDGYAIVAWCDKYQQPPAAFANAIIQHYAPAPADGSPSTEAPIEEGEFEDLPFE